MAADTNQLNNTERNNTITLEESQGNTLVVIDPRVDDYQMLARGVRKGVKVLILDDNSDGVEQITQALADNPTESLQVVCHGAPGCLYLGKTPLDREHLSRYSQQLMEWGVADIGLYACNVAADEEFLLRLHQLTGANIAASAQRVGNAGKGGSWLLEYILGQMRGGLAFEPSVVREYPGVFVSFEDAVNYRVGTTPRSIAVGDLNGDGQLDLVVGNYFSDNISVLLGSGNGGFRETTNLEVGNGPRSVKVTDIDGDAQLDLVMANRFSGNVSVLLGSGDGSFADPTNFEVGSGPISVAVGDLNDDGQLDLAVTNIDSDNVSVLLGSGDGSFGEATNFAVGDVPQSVAVGDLNGDGQLDLAVANQLSDNVSVLLGSGDGNFANATNFQVGSGPLSVAVEDLNGDGQLDLAVANGGSDNVSVLLGSRDGGFANSANFRVGDEPEFVTAGDLDGDGQLDLVVANFNSNNVSVLLNTTEIEPPPPAPTVEFSQATYQVSEDGSVEGVAITISRTGDTSSTSNVEVELSNGTATGDGIDFDNTTIPIEFAPDQTSAVINIPINDDDLVEDTENLNLTLVNATSGTIGNQNTAIVNIIDNETPPVNLDIDGNGDTDALTDGLLALKYLFGSTGAALINNSIGPNAQRTTAAEIIAYLDEARSTMLDVDGNGSADALTDGLLILKYLFGSTGEALISGAIGDGATRSNASDIINYLQSFDL
ncbi:MAG: FG-GAP-like repeat-containing protein [Hormoscilla sp.]